jgi:hypothetical protein
MSQGALCGSLLLQHGLTRLPIVVVRIDAVDDGFPTSGPLGTNAFLSIQRMFITPRSTSVIRIFSRGFSRKMAVSRARDAARPEVGIRHEIGNALCRANRPILGGSSRNTTRNRSAYAFRSKDCAAARLLSVCSDVGPIHANRAENFLAEFRRFRIARQNV